MMGCVGAGMEMVDGNNAGQNKGVSRTLGDARALPLCEVNTLMIPDHTNRRLLVASRVKAFPEHRPIPTRSYQ